MTIQKKFMKYVSQNIGGMIGISLYILADTFFISRAQGASGITALNLILPVYNLIFAIGAMIGVGSAIRFQISRAKGEKNAEIYFSNAIMWALLISVIFVLAGIFIPDEIVRLLGGDAEIVAIGTVYTRIFMLFTPFFMWNNICTSFVRNDGSPTIAMAATLGSSLFNIVMDYVLMFPLEMGMAGAALATAVSPILGILICCIHFMSGKSTIKLRIIPPSVKMFLQSCQLGVSSFIGEFASGVTTIVFNMLILHLVGNIGVAAYGVIANTSLVAIAAFNGVAQGSQPLLSDAYGKGNKQNMKKILHMGLGTALMLAVLMIAAVWVWTVPIAGIFNSEHNQAMAAYAESGLRLYFLGFLFAGFNIVGTSFLSATDSAAWAFVLSMLRGVAAIIFFAVVLSMLFGINGVWLAFAAAELLTLILTVIAFLSSGKIKTANSPE